MIEINIVKTLHFANFGLQKNLQDHKTFFLYFGFLVLSCVSVVAALLSDFPNYGVGRGPEHVHVNRALKKLTAFK